MRLQKIFVQVTATSSTSGGFKLEVQVPAPPSLPGRPARGTGWALLGTERPVRRRRPPSHRASDQAPAGNPGRHTSPCCRIQAQLELEGVAAAMMSRRTRMARPAARASGNSEGRVSQSRSFQGPPCLE